jgi:hypothetical protein
MTDDLKSARLRTRLAALADRAGAATGDERFPRAAGVLRGKPAGRRAVDDRAALELAKSLFDAGLARSKNDACTRAAILYSPTSLAIDATRARLLKKFGRN